MENRNLKAVKQLVLCLIFLIGPHITGMATTGSEARPAYKASRIEQPPLIDGRLDDTCWENAPVLAGLTQVLPIEGAQPSERTEVRIVYTDNQLFIGIRCFDSAPEEILAKQMFRDSNFSSDDFVSVAFDTFARERDGYLFAVNPAGARRDELYGKFGMPNRSWDTIWDTDASIDSQGWTVEIAIPFNSLSFDSDIEAWHWNIERIIRRKQETVRWTALSQAKRVSALEEMGELRGLNNLRQGLGLEFKPYLRGAYADGADNGKNDFDLKYGFDATYRITPSLTAVATFNTDFAETEVDDQIVNLSRFPLFFPEKRDFFLQDGSLFQFGGLTKGTTPYYSRRIGRGTDGSPVDILGGARITGRMSGTSLALLNVYQEEHADIKAKNLAVARISQQVFAESSVGGIFTYGDPLSNSDAWLGGLDFSYQNSRLPGDNKFTSKLFFLFSDTERAGGDDTAFGIDLDFPNDPWDIHIYFQQWGEKFEPALGFIGRKGVREYYFSFNHTWRPNTKLIRSWKLGLRPSFTTDLDNRIVERNYIVPTLTIQTPAGGQLDIGMTYYSDFVDNAYEIWPDVILPRNDYAYWQSSLSLRTSPARKLSASVSFREGDFYSGNQTKYTGSLDWRPSRYATLSGSYELNQVRLREGEFDVRLSSMRLDLALTPDLTWSTIAQYENRGESVAVNSRLRWTWRPGNDLILVWNHGWEYEDGQFENGNGKAVIKIGTTFRF